MPVFRISVILLLLISCQRSMVSPQDYVRYVQNPHNGLRVDKKINNVVFTAQYEPKDYIQLKNENTGSASGTQSAKEIEGTEYFILRIGSAGHGPLIEKKDDIRLYNTRLDYCNMLMQKDVVLIKGNDTLSCDEFQFERNFGIAPFNNFLLGFREKAMKPQSAPEDMTLVFYDGLFNSGTIKLHIDANDIKRIPKLKTI